MSEPAVRRDGDEFVVEFENAEEQRIDLTSVMHRVDAIAYRRYVNNEAQTEDTERGKREAALELARERRDKTH